MKLFALGNAEGIVAIPFFALALMLFTPSALSAGELVGHAIVRSDGSLLIKKRVVRLDGIYLPPTNRQCREWIRPVRCDSRAVLALDFKVKGFIHCFPRSENGDGSLNAVCYVNQTSFEPGEDLAAYLIEQGWALALPNAPFEYQAIEKIALSRKVGVWGYQVDSVTAPIYRRDIGRQ
ncbi:MAG: nuclease-like protein [Chromatiaceae bacterium]|jgi:endonuclease YncB( thermonuclease family)|nr:nuclease-like protein [Chromatiaceae bacterium]